MKAPVGKSINAEPAGLTVFVQITRASELAHAADAFALRDPRTIEKASVGVGCFTASLTVSRARARLAAIAEVVFIALPTADGGREKQKQHPTTPHSFQN